MSQKSKGGTKRTVLIAGAVNLIVALIKAVAGVLTSSSAMLAEAAHSVADTLNQAFLLTSISRARKPPDDEHPFGYGQERYFWSLLAAFGIFVLGAGFSIFEGILSLGRSTESGSVLIAYIVLVAAGAAETTSFVRAYRQMRGEASQERTGLVEHVKISPTRSTGGWPGACRRSRTSSSTRRPGSLSAARRRVEVGLPAELADPLGDPHGVGAPPRRAR